MVVQCGIQESWSHEEIDITYFSLPNYTLINANRRLSLHGGLITYIHDDFTFKELNDMLPISGTSTLFESLFIEIWKKNSHHQKYVRNRKYLSITCVCSRRPKLIYQ